jgi:hypothetical protein
VKSKAEIAATMAKFDAVRAEIARADSMTQEQIEAEAMEARQWLGNLMPDERQLGLFDRKRER